MKNALSFLLCMFCLLGCKQTDVNHSSKEGSISIDMDHLPEVSFYSIFSKMELFPLETTDESLIKMNGKPILHNNNLYIYDDMLKVIHIFDLDSKYIHTINKYGNGPGEYTGLADFNFNHFTNNFELLSPIISHFTNQIKTVLYILIIN